MAYSKDIREAALACVLEGKAHDEIIDFLKISKKTLSNWIRQYRESGTLEVKTRQPYRPRKVDKTELVAHLDAEPDATLEELAAPFGVAHSVIDYHLRKMKITRKKNHAIRGEKRRKETEISDRDQRD